MSALDCLYRALRSVPGLALEEAAALVEACIAEAHGESAEIGAEFGIRLPGDGFEEEQVIDLTRSRHTAEARLRRYRDTHPGACLMVRAVRYGPWAPAEDGDAR